MAFRIFFIFIVLCRLGWGPYVRKYGTVNSRFKKLHFSFLKSRDVWFKKDLCSESRNRSSEKNAWCRWICKLRSLLNREFTVLININPIPTRHVTKPCLKRVKLQDFLVFLHAMVRVIHPTFLWFVFIFAAISSTPCCLYFPFSY